MGGAASGERVDASGGDADRRQQPDLAGARGAPGVADPAHHPAQAARGGALLGGPHGDARRIPASLGPLRDAPGNTPSWRFSLRQQPWRVAGRVVAAVPGEFLDVCNEPDVRRRAGSDCGTFHLHLPRRQQPGQTARRAHHRLLRGPLPPHLLLDAGSVHRGGHGRGALPGAAIPFLLHGPLHVRRLSRRAGRAGPRLVRRRQLPPRGAAGGTGGRPPGVRGLPGLPLAAPRPLQPGAGPGVERGAAAVQLGRHARAAPDGAARDPGADEGPEGVHEAVQHGARGGARVRQVHDGRQRHLPPLFQSQSGQCALAWRPVLLFLFVCLFVCCSCCWVFFLFFSGV